MCFFGSDETLDAIHTVLPTVVEALTRATSLKGAVFLSTSSAFADQLKPTAEISARYFERYLDLEKRLLELPYPTAAIRVGAVMEQFFFQFKDSVREQKTFSYVDCSISLVRPHYWRVNLLLSQLQVAQSDLTECLIAVLQNPRRIAVTLATSDLLFAKDVPFVLSALSRPSVN